MIKKFSIEIASVGVLIVLLGLIGNTITGNAIKSQQKEEKTVVYFPNVAEFVNTEEGYIFFDFSLPSGFKVGNKSVDMMIFLDSAKMPGFKMGYDVNSKKVFAGMPVLTTDELNIFDNQRHKIVYAFNRELKKQAIILDDKILVEGEFTGIANSNPITGFAVFERWNKVESPITIDSWSE